MKGPEVEENANSFGDSRFIHVCHDAYIFRCVMSSEHTFITFFNKC